ncbi:hydroxyisourate hydrolase [Flavihumibacter rivuli]|uniref:hydroxyisourate hydrolase n=1 Tax=Flavihumibacter rivuli TaxID=2838156 RepID=UPI001BDF56E4|nr:hydroxyisourate hydrolase [Flavihumibacter rivuli]ULQ55469.1 hydroxyisourate hydrolase [Flavihumibacter rivuli]
MKKLILLFSVILACQFSLQAQDKSYQLSTHILDISSGSPATGVTIRLERYDSLAGSWKKISEQKTDGNGRIKDFLPTGGNNDGTYKLVFLTREYFERRKWESFYPFIEVVFAIRGSSHYHVPLTLSPFGYSTYRGN